MNDLGMSANSEKITALCTPLATHAERVGVEELLLCGRGLKGYLANLKDVRGAIGPTEYPADVVEFQMILPHLYDQAYSEHLLVSSRWTPSLKQMRVGVAPCRSSKTGCE